VEQLGFWKRAEIEPDRLALVDVDETEVTAGELLSAANRVANGLVAIGVGRDDTVAVVMPNSRAMYEVYLGALQIGAYLTPINHHLVGPEIAYIVEDSDAKVLIGHERFADALIAAAEQIGLAADHRFAIGDVEGFRPFSDLTAGQSDDTPADRVSGAAMHYTSGTTGKPKGVKRGRVDADPSDMGAMFAMFLMMFGIQPEDDNVHIVGSPLYHTAVLMWSASSMHLGHPVVLMDKWDGERMLELIDRYRVTTSHMVPTQFHRMLALPEEVRAKYDCSSTRVMVHAAAPCPVPVKQQMLDWWGDSIHEYYAATEGGGTIVSPQEWRERPGTVGKAWAGSAVVIRDDEGDDLPTGEVGTIWMAMGQAAFEYKDDPEKTAASQDREGFFTVGDVGFLDDEGYLFLSDRKIDMIISGGVNIYPSEIESAFLSNPEIGDVAVFGVPNEDWGEEVKAVIEPAAGVEAGPAFEARLRTWAETNLASYKRPRTYDFTDDMPRDPSGKLYKRKLRDPYWEGRDRAI